MWNAKGCNVVHRLHSQQLGEKHRSCILLGFTAEGHHLLSYTSTLGYRLQIWSFLWGQQAEFLAEIDLFGVVHGCTNSTDVDDALADAMNYVTVMPHPCTQGLSLQGFHFKYASIRGQISQPLFALIPPCTLMLHSSKGIQFLELKQYAMHLNPKCSLGNTQQLSHHDVPLQAAAADSAAALYQPGEAEACASAAQPALADDDALVVQEHHAPTVVSDQKAARAAVQPSSVQAKPAHSVWSMSASSDSLSSHPIPPCPDVSSVARPMTSPESPGTHVDGYRRQLLDGASHIDGLSHFHINSSLRRGNDDTGCSAAVSAELIGPVFDPERFIMDCIPHDKLHSHRLVDYTVQQVLCGDDTDRPTYGLPICKGISCSLSAQAGRGWSLEARACTGEAWAIVLISAVFQPRTGAGQETVTPVTFVVNVCSSSGTGELLGEEWMDAAKFQQLVENLRFFPKAYTMEQADFQRVAIVTLAQRLAGKLKLKHSIPTSPHMRPIVLNNRAMLSSGRSAGLLTHPLLPICILGYGQHGTA
ncbi:MAG: hypothetical protein FRX49_11436 [Trebouxia sp. A1-2]|nr:MAG: hypothetical protein FRX49_11436 [Trebouxia sp. A1-2]